MFEIILMLRIIIIIILVSLSPALLLNYGSKERLELLAHVLDQVKYTVGITHLIVIP